MSDEEDEFVEDSTSTTEDFTDSDTTQYSSDDMERDWTERADKADEIDPLKLVETPSPNEIRQYYRKTFAKTIVDKPVDDSFKNGFNIDDDTNNTIRDEIERLDFVDKYKSAQKKARRDGFAGLFYVLKDNSAVHEAPEGVSSIEKLNILRLDDLKLNGVNKSLIDDKVPLEKDNYIVTKYGIIVNKDITSVNYNEIVGYVMDYDDGKMSENINPQVVHADRVDHYVWNDEVDDDVNSRAVGHIHGDSVLMPSFHLIKWVFKADYAVAQSVFRDASKLYVVKMPEGSDEDDFDKAEKEMGNLNSQSTVLAPYKYEVEEKNQGNPLDPEPHLDILFSQICAATEMTKSVLFGTQTGTVTGSETDIKNYFNKVHRIRQNRFERDIHNFVSSIKNWSKKNPNMEYDIQWEEMFKLNQLDKIEALRTSSNAATMLTNGFIFTPDEIRNILEDEWAKLGIDISPDELTEEQWEELERVNIGQTGRITNMGNPRKQNGGGMPQGNQTASNQPTRDEEDGPNYEY